MSTTDNNKDADGALGRAAARRDSAGVMLIITAIVIMFIVAAGVVFFFRWLDAKITSAVVSPTVIAVEGRKFVVVTTKEGVAICPMPP